MRFHITRITHDLFVFRELNNNKLHIHTRNLMPSDTTGRITNVIIHDHIGFFEMKIRFVIAASKITML